MLVADLIAELQQFDEDAEVMIAHQPGWPLAEVISDIQANPDTDDEEYDDVEPDPNPDDEDESDNVVWIVAGGHDGRRSPYAPRALFNGGW